MHSHSVFTSAVQLFAKSFFVYNHMIWQSFQNASYTPTLTAKTHTCVICDIFNTKVNNSLALIKKQGLIATALSIQIVPFGLEQSDYLQIQRA